MEVEMLQHQASETLRNGARQLVVREIQGSEAGEVAQLGGNGARQLVVGEIQAPEAGEVTQLGRNGARQLVEPFAKFVVGHDILLANVMFCP